MCETGNHFSIEGYTKGVAFLLKMVHKRVRSWTSGGRLKTLLISRAIYVQMSLTFFLLKARMFKSTTPAPGTGPYFTSVSRNDSQLEIIASFHAKSRRLLMLVVKNKSTSLRWELKSISCQFFEIILYYIDDHHGRHVTWFQTKNTH